MICRQKILVLGTAIVAGLSFAGDTEKQACNTFNQRFPPIYSVQAQASGSADQSVCGNLQAEYIVKTMIEKISSSLMLKGKGSVACSPVSITAVLGMMLASMGDNCDKEKLLGIPNGSLTPELENEIHQLLGKFSRSHSCDNAMGLNNNHQIVNFNLIVSNEHGFDEQYLQMLYEYYLAEKLADNHMNESEIIDAYVQSKTNDKITMLFDGESKSDRYSAKVILCNVMDIKANWETAFSPDSTFLGSFQREDGSIVNNVWMMRITENLPTVTHHGFKALSKDFKSENGEELKLVVIRPAAFNPIKIKDLNRLIINEIMNKLASCSSKEKVQLTLPKMAIESSDNKLNEKISQALNTDIQANQLSKLKINGKYYRLDIIQKIKASIDEQGARVVVASAAKVIGRGWGSGTDIFEVNCPSFVVITNGKENLLEVVLRCEKFLSTNGPAMITPAFKLIDDRSTGDELTDNKLDLYTLIQSKLDPNREFDILSIDNKSSNTIDIYLGSIDKAEKLQRKILTLIGKRYEPFVDVWGGELLDQPYVSVSFGAKEALMEQLTR